MAARSFLFQLPRFVSSRLSVLYHRASPSAGHGLQRKLAADISQKEATTHGEGGDAAIAATSRLPRDREADVAAELLTGKRRAPSPKPRPPSNPVEGSGGDTHNSVPDKKYEEGKHGTRNNYAVTS
jgi:hypothetical protein